MDQWVLGEDVGENYWRMEECSSGFARRQSSQQQWLWWRSFALALGAWFKWGGEGQGMEPAAFKRERGGCRARASERRRVGRWLVRTGGEATTHCGPVGGGVRSRATDARLLCDGVNGGQRRVGDKLLVS